MLLVAVEFDTAKGISYRDFNLDVYGFKQSVGFGI